ncbi:hypothetical protein Goshw_001473 [Gossypium schwendimanii]|uniref:Uncharacterized protein n=1 Tax=Gossypium schwendimanii TaxID=34291 RepID=A0A7J9N3P0_GOSSC|nr:hypothetical protein [Gossypium schwendimanii]
MCEATRLNKVKIGGCLYYCSHGHGFAFYFYVLEWTTHIHSHS